MAAAAMHWWSVSAKNNPYSIDDDCYGRWSAMFAMSTLYRTYGDEDTGPDVPADKAEAIFQRFTKLNEFVQGTGLGLSICRDIASRMQGEVYLDTSYTAGARFVFTLPVQPSAGGHPQES